MLLSIPIINLLFVKSKLILFFRQYILAQLINIISHIRVRIPYINFFAPYDHDSAAPPAADDDEDDDNNNSNNNEKREINNLHLIKLKMQPFCWKSIFYRAAIIHLLHDDSARPATTAPHLPPPVPPLVNCRMNAKKIISRGRTTGIINITFLSHVPPTLFCIIISTAHCILCDSRFYCKIFTI